MKLELTPRIVEKPCIRFHENPFSGSRIVCMWTERQTAQLSLFAVLRTRVNRINVRKKTTGTAKCIWCFLFFFRLCIRSLTLHVPFIVTIYINKPTRCTFCMYLFYNFCTTLHVSNDHFVNHQAFMIYCILQLCTNHANVSNCSVLRLELEVQKLYKNCGIKCVLLVFVVLRK